MIDVVGLNWYIILCANMCNTQLAPSIVAQSPDSSMNESQILEAMLFGMEIFI